MPAVDVTPALCPPPSLALGRSRCNGSGKTVTPAGVTCVGRPLPEAVSASSPHLVRALTTSPRWRRGVDKNTMTRIAMSWFDMEH